MLQGSEAQLRRAEAKLDAALNAALGDDPDDLYLADDFDAADSGDEGVPALRQGSRSRQGEAAAGKEDPASFSRIDLSQPEAQIRAASPQFPVRPLSPLACLLYHCLQVPAWPTRHCTADCPTTPEASWQLVLVCACHCST